MEKKRSESNKPSIEQSDNNPSGGFVVEPEKHSGQGDVS
jgi:hypothetical protein